MKKLAAAIAVVLLGAAITAYAQSLGELAKKEKERREKLKGDSKVITNSDTPKYANSNITTVSLPTPAPADKSAGEKTVTEPTNPAAALKAAADEPTDFQGRPESFWRQTFADARQKVKELENESNVLILRINDLQNRFYRTDDGFQRQAIQADLQKTFYQQDLNKQNLAKARAMLEDLEKEARKSGALPGWISGKNP